MKVLSYLISILSVTCVVAQDKPTRGAEGFPDLVNSMIAGAPVLSKPFLVKGNDKAIFSQGHGLGAPAFYDWDGDGLKDLLIGEFGTGAENGMYMGNFIRLYKNIGTMEQPEFSGQFDYARPPFLMPGNGTPYSVDQFCCIGFTPQFVDLNADGNLDMITGQYYGEVSWFKGSEGGFMPGEFLQQQPSPNGPPRLEPKGKTARKDHQRYWLFSPASFGDFTNDGRPDLITGGIDAIQISKNIGIESAPQFGQRDLLVDTKGSPLKVYTYNEEQLNEFEKVKFLGITPPVAGDDHTVPYVVDWDNDGALDLLITNSYVHGGLNTVDFFKGVQTTEGYRFEPAVPLFKAPDDAKAFPGSSARVSVTDWNNDGINDLLIGTAVLTVHGKFSDLLSWSWEDDNGLRGPGKDPANAADLPPIDLARYKASVRLPAGVSIDEYLTIRHQGYVYVMLGNRQPPALKTHEKKRTKAKKKI
jgi:hypothetical protein